jgi:hypothetical protein
MIPLEYTQLPKMVVLGIRTGGRIMRMKPVKIWIKLLVCILCIPALLHSNITIVQAATPKFAKSKIELVGVGESYKLEINNKVAKSSYKWTTSDKKVVKVSSKGVLTSVGGGTATIRCKITYPSKSTKTLSCKVTVTVPADGVKISNAKEKNGAHIMTIGESYQFESDLTPQTSTDKVFWSIGSGAKDSIRIDNAELGKVTALKEGKVTLKATAAKDAKEAVENGNINLKNDAIIIEVVAPRAEVKTAEIIGPTEIKVEFDSPVDKSTIIDSSNKLTSNIKITLGKDNKNNLASDPGNLTPSLSTDAKTLTITTSNMLTGTYGIEFTDGIKTTSGTAMDSWYTTLSYIDTVPPYIVSASVDDTGMINIIQFNEPIDISNMKIPSSSEVYNSSFTGTATTTTFSTINNPSNYILSEDKKSLTLNMSKISPSDYGRTFTVSFTGIKDLSGLSPAGFTLQAVVRTDASKKAQAVPLYVTRTAYKTLTATFSRALQTPGNLYINGAGSYPGILDAKDAKKVNYTISDSDALITGLRNVTVSGYNSYNVIETDNSAYAGKTLSVDFTVDKNGPILIDSVYDSDSAILTLTFNEEVDLSSSTGIFSTILDTMAGERIPGTNITYTRIASDDKKIVKLKITNMSRVGSYTFTLEPTFAMDNFRNQMTSRTITISNASGTSAELPGPFAITQSSSNLNEINLEFINMVDTATAQDVNNYTIPGVTIISAYVSKNTIDNGATVVLTVADGSIDVTAERPIYIRGVMGYKGTHSAITSFTKTVELKENKKPTCIDMSFDKNMRNNIKLTFNEQIKGTISFKVTQQTSTVPYEISNSVIVSGNTITINLGSIPTSGSYLRVEVLSNTITDSVGNALTSLDSTFGVYVSY